MSKLTTKKIFEEIEANKKPGKGIYIGNHKVKISKIEYRDANPATSKPDDCNELKRQVTLVVETPPIDHPEWEGMVDQETNETYKGQVGWVKSMYLGAKDQREHYLVQMAEICKAMGVQDLVEKIESDEKNEQGEELNHTKKVHSWIDKFIESKIWKDKFVYLKIVGNEYPKKDGTVGLNLMLAKYDFCASVEDQESGDPKRMLKPVNVERDLRRVERPEYSSGEQNQNKLTSLFTDNSNTKT